MSFGHFADPLSRARNTYRVAVLGAESSGKTTLATGLTAALCELGYNAGLVPEYLRTWCQENARLPDFVDQDVVLAGQLASEETAAARYDVLVCDPAAITTGFYSRIYFKSDRHLQGELLDRYDHVFLCDIDFPWQPDPLRESDAARAQMQSLIVTYLTNVRGSTHPAIPTLSGSASQRLSSALDHLNLAESAP